ncbi:hypothetical protein BaRGS_00021231 [Batillaria attramentaria]|uniref:Cyclic nucleotide-binding domain-containing protein n=1 Tax=Batillaria attramentaria TaxID=370345 RepID=A0ABD0KK46_9CAEN
MDIPLLLAALLATSVVFCAAQTQDSNRIESEEGIDLVLPDYLTTTWPTDTGFALILESLERLEAENTQMKRELQEMRAEMTDRAASCPRLCEDSIKASESRLRTQVNQLEDEVENLRTQQTLLTQQAEITLTVVDVVEEFQDEYINITDRLDLLEERQSSLEAMTVRGTNHVFVSTQRPQNRPAKRLFTVSPSTIEPGHTYTLIRSLVVTNDEKIVMADEFQRKMRVMTLENRQLQGEIRMNSTQASVALLDDGLVAVATNDGRQIALVNVSGSDPQVASVIPTLSQYQMVCQGEGDTLVVGASGDRFNRLDVLSRDGQIVRTLVDSRNDSNLRRPFFLTRWRDDVYVSDWGRSRIYKVNLETGRINSTFGELNLSDLDLNEPRAVTFDDDGNMYAATGGRACAEGVSRDAEWCILQMRANGSVSVFVEIFDKWPYGVGVAPGVLVLSLAEWSDGWKTELRGYELPV